MGPFVVGVSPRARLRPAQPCPNAPDRGGDHVQVSPVIGVDDEALYGQREKRREQCHRCEPERVVGRCDAQSDSECCPDQDDKCDAAEPSGDNEAVEVGIVRFDCMVLGEAVRTDPKRISDDDVDGDPYTDEPLLRIVTLDEFSPHTHQVCNRIDAKRGAHENDREENSRDRETNHLETQTDRAGADENKVGRKAGGEDQIDPRTARKAQQDAEAEEKQDRALQPSEPVDAGQMAQISVDDRDNEEGAEDVRVLESPACAVVAQERFCKPSTRPK